MGNTFSISIPSAPVVPSACETAPPPPPPPPPPEPPSGATSCVAYSAPIWFQTESPDSPWFNDDYDHTTHKFADKGCALTALAMSLAHARVLTLPNGNRLNPGTLNEYLKAAVCDAKVPAIARVIRPNGNEHFVLVTGKENGRFTVVDPDAGRQHFLDEFTKYETRGSIVRQSGERDGESLDAPDFSAINLTIIGAGRLLLSGPDGAATGFSAQGLELNQLRQSATVIDRIDGDLSGLQGEESQILSSMQPTAGSYSVIVSGFATGSYRLTFGGTNIISLRKWRAATWDLHP